MLNIEILSRKEEGRNQESQYVVINGIPDYGSSYWVRRTNGGKGTVVLNDEDLIEGTVIKCTIADLSQHFSEVDFSWTIDNWEFWIDLKFKFDSNTLDIEFKTDWEEWERPYSIKKFSEELKKIAETDSTFQCQYFCDEEFVTNGFGLSFRINDNKLVLEDIIGSKLDIIEECIMNIHVSILNQLDNEILSVYFRFPEEIKSACNQYLIYFGQFLSDMGIEARTEVKEEVEGTLFRVLPNSQSDAIENIKNALDIYIGATSKEGYQIISTSDSYDVSIAQWKANILHLKSQLMLAESVLQMKDATIESLKLSNFQYNKLLEAQSKSIDQEKIVGGLVKIKEYDGNGFSIDLPSIIRKLKRKLNIK